MKTYPCWAWLLTPTGCLHAPFTFDRTLIRNPLAFDLSNEMDMWATNWRFVEVYLNRSKDAIVSSTDYAGVYVLMEKVEQGKNRIDITEITRDRQPGTRTSAAVTSGRLTAMTRMHPGFTAGGQPMNWVYPKSPD